MIQRSRKMISSPWSYLIISFFSGRSWSPQSNGGHRHADKQLLRDDGSALMSMPRALKEAALHWVWGKIVREDEVEPSLERQGEFLWDPRRKNALYSNKRSGKGKGEGNRMTHLKNGKEVGFPTRLSVNESACQCRRCKRHGLDPWVGKIPWRRAWQPTPVFLPGKSHGQRAWRATVCGLQRDRHDLVTKHTKRRDVCSTDAGQGRMGDGDGETGRDLVMKKAPGGPWIWSSSLVEKPYLHTGITYGKLRAHTLRLYLKILIHLILGKKEKLSRWF